MKYINRILVLFVALVMGHSMSAQQPNADLEKAIKDFFASYKPTVKTGMPIGLQRIVVNDSLHVLDIYATEGFASQVFTPEMVDQVYDELSRRLPQPYNTYYIGVYGFDKEISELIPNIYSTEKDTARLWGSIAYEGNEWVRNMSKPFQITCGLQGRHITIWQSHGKYFDFKTERWLWQRPRIWSTTEDLFTRSFVLPFLMPMLENAGAVAYTPRERDQHSFELIVDNDLDGLSQSGKYYEVNTGKEAFDTCSVAGFKKVRDVYVDDQNPHREGTARKAFTIRQPKKNELSTCWWVPEIPVEDDYAVYVTYPTLPNSVDDATYVVHHGKIETKVRVNQQMGGGTWVYLGTFHFQKGCSEDNAISLTNQSDMRGVVTADAIRIGGGMGNVARGGKLSGLPRYLEGARYSAQWFGMPNNVYNTKDNRNDYGDDINVRSNVVNYLAGGSSYVPDTAGVKVPMELSLAVHSDAGYKADNQIIGTLSIYTLNGDRGTTDFLSGVSRMASSDFAGILQTDVCRELSNGLGRTWTRRELYNRNYSECRKPEVPSAILETLSHQNFQDMLYGHDPVFKFMIARGMYKGIARFVALQHGKECVFQPLPVKNFVAEVTELGALLSWEPRVDALDESAKPTHYIVYTRKEGQDFDNGTVVENGETTCELPIEDGCVYSYKVTACNEGGESFPSEVLSVMRSGKGQIKALVVNGFTRLSSPAVYSTPDSLGFDLNDDIGVPYINTAEYCGAQTGWSRSQIGKEGDGGLGWSGAELEGTIIAGNNFDYVSTHVQAIKESTRGCWISSCSVDALESINMQNYKITDLVLGLQKDDGKSSILPYKTFTPTTRSLLDRYVSTGGRLLVSGAYVSTDNLFAEDSMFVANKLGFVDGGTIVPTNINVVGKAEKFSLVTEYNSLRYAVKKADVLNPIAGAQSLVNYADGRSAGVVFSPSATGRVVSLGFPFEAIKEADYRKHLMINILKALMQ